MSDVKHETTLHCMGDWYTWTCTCGKKSRHHAPLHNADRNAKAHEAKAKRDALKAVNTKDTP